MWDNNSTTSAIDSLVASSPPFQRAPDSDMVTQAVLENLGDRLLSHHANRRQSLSKDRFEFALEAALNASNIRHPDGHGFAQG